jgi:23S rRNA pseudouridine2605 synthase
MAERLQKFLARAGVASRRKVEEMIVAGRVSVNGTTAQLGMKVNEQARITVDGRPVKDEEARVYVMLHKPEGYITAVSDPEKRRVVVDLVRDIPVRLVPVGRLDYDSSGLLILSNDGELTQRLTHPRYEVAKTYIAQLRGTPDQEGLRAFKAGLRIDDGLPTAPAHIKILRREGGNATAQIILKEGRNRQIRKMCAAIGCPVMALKRVSVGKLHLGNLPRGQYRFLTAAEIRLLTMSTTLI